MVYSFGMFRFDSAQGLLFRSEILVPLNQKSLRALSVLLEHHGRLVTKEDLIFAIWPDTFVEENNLSQCISNLRQALGDGSNRKRYIQTVVRKGFCFVAPVTVLDPEIGFRGLGSRTRESVSGNGDPGLATWGSGLWDRDPRPGDRDSGLGNQPSQAGFATDPQDISQPGSARQSAAPVPAKPGISAPADRGSDHHGPGTLGATAATDTQGWQDSATGGVATSPGAAGSNAWLGRRDAGATVANRAPTDRHWGRGIQGVQLWKLAALAILVMSVFLGLHALRRRTSLSTINWSQVTHDGHAKQLESALLTDGPRLYFEESVNNHPVIASVAASGGETSIVNTPGGLSLSNLSPDRANLLLFGELPGENERRLWTSSPSGSSVEGLNGLAGSNASWSPDGSRIVFARGNAVYIAASDGTGERKLTDTGYDPQWLRWSPDGKFLRFTVGEQRAQLESIWQVSADASNLHQFISGWSKGKYVCCGNWTADGRFFVFQAMVNGRTDIWAARERRSFFSSRSDDPIQITAGPMNYYSPLPSPDGKRLFVIGERLRAELMQLDIASHHFAEFLSGISATDVSFSMDGKWVAYVTFPEFQLWRSRADGSDARRLTAGNMTVDEPHWSPDGKQIAFLGVTDGPTYKAYVVPADGGRVRPFIAGPSEEGVATWSPDGKSVVFGELLHRKPNSQMAIHLLNLTTHQLTTLPGSQGLWSARWSPDGRYIAAASSNQERNFPSLWLYDVKTRKWSLMAKVSGINEPAWTSTSDYIYFGTPLSPTDPGLYRVRVRDHKLERLGDLKPNPQGEMWTGVTPDGSPLIVRNAASQEIYALDWKLGR
jgi:Tol biopolymer transport system component/DNA-binding winged helix-turn-helix (wHTH) protein